VSAAAATTAVSAISSPQKQQESAPPPSPPSPRSDSAVQLQVQDVRDLVGGGGGAGATQSSSAPSHSSAATSPTNTPAVTTSSFSSSSSQATTDESLERLLADAREMEGKSTSEGGDGGISVPKVAVKVISTIITADFFLVCFFLLWFLAGVFSSYVLKDDAIQISLNQIFQPVVQPALGVLMIGAVLSGVFKDPEEEEDEGGFGF